MKPKTNGPYEAKKLLADFGFDEIGDYPLDLFVSGLGGILIEEPLTNCDGRIVFGNTKTLIKINSGIPHEQRKRFAIAHEIGHLLMHKNMDLPEDTRSSFNIIEGMENHLRFGQQELEANEFASELLMPTNLFIKEAKGSPFSPQLLRDLATRFNTSLTATAFKYMQCDLHPIFLAMSENGRVRYWKKSDSMYVRVPNLTRLAPPTDSVAAEYINGNYGFIYNNENKAQIIDKSTWFNIGATRDTPFYEYCIPTKTYKTVLSIVWED